MFLSFTLVTGEGGMLWLCQIAFAGIGAIGAAWFADNWGVPILLAIVMGGLVAGAIGVVIGLLTIRLGNLYIALVTLTFALLMERLVFTLDTFAQNGVGRVVVRPEFAVDRPRRGSISASRCSRSSPSSPSTSDARPPGSH